MGATGAVVVHVIASDMPPGKVGVLRALCGCDEVAARQVLVHVGRGAVQAAGLPAARRARAPIEVGWLRRRALGRVLDGLREGQGGGRLILHFWSPAALAWGLSLDGARYPWLVEAEAGDELRAMTGRLGRRGRGIRRAVVCPSAATRRRLLRFGVPGDECVVVRECVDEAEIGAVSRARARERLELEEEQRVLVALPPISRRAGALLAAWATLLVQRAREDVRLIVPAGGEEQQPVRRLVRCAGHERRVRFAAARVSLAECVVAADLAVYVPMGDAPVTGLAWAMAGGVAIVASAVPTVTELLVDGGNAWLCRPGNVRDAAGRCLHALEHKEESRRLAAAARVQAGEWFGRQRMTGQYARLYANLAAGRSPVEGSAIRAWAFESASAR